MPIKVLYASCRYNPLDRDAGSGVDFNIYEALKNSGFELKIVGPFKNEVAFPEKVYRFFHRAFSRKLAAKFSIRYLKSSASKVESAILEFQPDAIFTHNLIPLVYLNTTVPIIYKTDAVLYNMHSQWPTYSRLELKRMLRWEKVALGKASRVITASRWAESALLDHYQIQKDRIIVLPIPSSLPIEEIPGNVEFPELSGKDVKLLAVAKDYHLKGIDIAEEVIDTLRAKGIRATLRVAGQSGIDRDGVQFMGLFRKDNPKERARYLEQYAWADFLIHPARYEAAGIVCGEAAAFGVPTITNAIGGLASTVEQGISGEVLPIGSPAGSYVKVIEHYLENPKKFAALRSTTRERYLNELNWASAGKRIAELIQQAVDDPRLQSKESR